MIEGLVNKYDLSVTETKELAGGITSFAIKFHASNLSEDQMFSTAKSYGVSEKEMNFALNVLEENGYNVASFGVLGYLVSADFEGTNQ